MRFGYNFSVVQELDDLKRKENGARNAIRWLEREFKEGKMDSSSRKAKII